MTNQELQKANELKSSIDEIGEVLMHIDSGVTEIFIVTKTGTTTLAKRDYEDLVKTVLDKIKSDMEGRLNNLESEFNTL